MSASFQVTPIGYVRKEGGATSIEIDPGFSEALLGIDQFSHIMVFYWFHENDTTAGRRTLTVHPRGNPQNPLTGVFATHSPRRPNLIALTVCRLVRVVEHRLIIEEIDARDGSPVIDLKCYISGGPDIASVRVPDWV